MANLKIFRETALPGSLTPSAIYFIAPASDAVLVEIVVTNAAGDATRHVINKADVQGMIDASMAAAGANNLIIVDDITARDALTPDSNIQVFVVDATGDATVASGGATYLYRFSTTSWIKINEAESMDVVLSWSALSGKPTSSAADIDDAVSKRHTHANKTQLDKIDEDGNGNLTYNGALPVTGWASTGW